jgi:hypothetical protein
VKALEFYLNKPETPAEKTEVKRILSKFEGKSKFLKIFLKNH